MNFANFAGVGTGIISQVATFGAMLIPMALGRMDQVGFVVVVSAIASISARICGLAFPGIYPVLSDADAPGAVTATVRTTLCAAAIATVGAGVLIVRDSAFVDIVVWSIAMSVAMVFYEIVNSMFVRRAQYKLYARVRLIYGLTSLVSVAAISMVTDWKEALAATGVLSYVVGWLVGVSVMRARVLRSWNETPVVETFSYIRTHKTAIVSSAIDIFGSQVSSLSVSTVGVTSGAGIVWSGLQRIAGGVMTTFGMLVAPGLDMNLARAVRSGTREDVSRTVRTSVALSGGLAAVAAIVTVPATIIVLSISKDFSVEWSFILAMVCHCFAIFSLAAIYKFLLLMGAVQYMAYWCVLRAATAAIVLLVITNQLAIIYIAIHSVVMAALLLGLVMLALRGHVNLRTSDPLPDWLERKEPVAQ
ncbi:hypothetical protein KRX51_08515 [Corynebacterium sp. TAE3-ERU12]|uniref:hypothetical protein n=1 Tax=Corynebacterium sp. TAE3-ERU12 TaxID=2849491 RepID=UPI001C47EB24|nr:hypothetical protein [Corynebacterium sp. TAE3-ERU12]MBV7295950.1 hypothetical protein [Corynebacterium sp. TAE3-ERU12]